MLHKCWHHFLKKFSITTEPVVLFVSMRQGIEAAQAIEKFFVIFSVQSLNAIKY